MKIIFHTMSLPTARLVWHCPFVDLYYADDKKPFGEGYREYALIRLDGENWAAVDVATNKLIVNKSDVFNGWEAWKEANKKGYEVTINIKREGNIITATTENLGIGIKNTTTIIEDHDGKVYALITGDQVAITNIRIIKED